MDRLQMKLTKGEFEYSMDVYYIKKFQKPEGATVSTYRAWGCSAPSQTGILCQWPICMFCGEEHFVGATISTPRFKNIKLVEGSVTQVFPNQRIDIVLKTSGIFKWHNGHFKASVTHAENSSLIHSPNLREQVNKKIQEHKVNETESMHDGDNPRKISVYSFTSEVSNELLGFGGVSAVFMSSRDPSLDLYGGELSYPFGSQQKASFLTTMYKELRNANNVTRGNVAETIFRSTQFPILDFDSKIRAQTTSSNSKKVLYAIKPINLGKGEIKVETIDNVSEYGATESWTNFHIDQTYKLYLPETFLTRYFKGRIVIERVEEVIQEAAVEVLFGSQNGLEIRYDFIPDEDNTVEFFTSMTAKGELYGLHHRLEPVQEIVTNGDADTHSDSQKYKYKGTYIFEDSTMKAVGVFVARNDREILPFSKFDVRVSSVDGIDLGIRYEEILSCWVIMAVWV
ncbi:unnamed protein product [Orchesella dallaii]|uniref:Uncharacterized protein n=1 Tax=Orchesella dallaii TaxID=48710 RepID=A0ABP1Q9I4_9HEXA